MHQSNYQKCHQNQMNQVNTQVKNHKSHRDRDHLKNKQQQQQQQQQNQRATTQISKNHNFISNNCLTQCHKLHLFLLLFLLILQHSAASPGSSSSRRDALLAYYKRAQLRQSDPYGIQEEYHLHEGANIDFDDLSPTGSVVSTLSNAERLRKRSATSTTAQTVAPTTTAPPTTTTTAATAATRTTESSKTQEKCEAKVLESLPDEPVSETYIDPIYYPFMNQVLVTYKDNIKVEKRNLKVKLEC